MTAYFIRQHGDLCAVIALHPGDREEAVQSGLSFAEAETLCVRLIEGLPTPETARTSYDHRPLRNIEPRRDLRQLTLKF